ncbi:hypothetical protein F5Y03DRAFT_377233 [Xylaria venustula]|nr:hypothetical protein F5Y03DRAFT_377233 [Xylaria venustula]
MKCMLDAMAVKTVRRALITRGVGSSWRLWTNDVTRALIVGADFTAVVEKEAKSGALDRDVTTVALMQV